jgi:protein-tyrosine kinase
MSKIEEALKRARSEKNLPVPQARRPETSGDGTGSSSAETDAETARGFDLILRNRLAGSVAKMRQGPLTDATALIERRIIVPDPRAEGAADAFREIRTKILRKAHGRNCVIMVTSVAPRAGTSFVSVNLGVAFALDAAKTALLVECNLRNAATARVVPTLADEQLLGLTDYLEQPDMDISGVIHPTGIERLRVIPAGQIREIPAEYFMSHRMRSLVDDIRGRYPDRFVILDSPPMTQAADAQTLAEMADYVVLVVPYGQVTNAQIDACLKAIDPKKLIGIVFNNEPRVEREVWRQIPREAVRLIRERAAYAWQRIVDSWTRLIGRLAH